MRMRSTVLGLTLALAGCGGGEYDFGPRGGGRGLPEVAMRPNADRIVPPGRGQLGLAVRSFVPLADGGWQEVAGARCQVAGGVYFRAELVTPARLVVPDLGPDAPPLTADCATATARGSDVAPPVFAWPAEGLASAPARMWWGGGWWWGFQKSGPMRYPDLAVALR